MELRPPIIFLGLLLALSACRKKYDHPPFAELADGQQTTVQQLRQKVPTTSSVYRFAGGDTSLYCTVTADASSGNFYSTVFVRDDEHVAIQVNLTEPGGVYSGDRLRINLNGVTMRHANNCFTLDSVSAARNIVKLSSGNKVIPKQVTMEQLLQSLNGGIDLQSDLITLEETEFVYEHRGVTFADAIAQSKKELTLTNCNGYTVALQTSGFANFAAKLTPHEHGSVTAVVTRYGSTLRLQMRNFSDLNMQSPACTSSLSTIAGTFVLSAAVGTLQENFDQVNDEWELQLAGWINYNESGRARWRGDLKAEQYRSVKATAFGTGEKNTTWLISPPVTYSSEKKISFRTAVEYFKYGHIEPLMAYVSTDFNGKNLKTANWTSLTQANYAGHSDGNYTGPGGMKSSGEMRLADIPLLAAAQGTFCLAFKYTGEPGFDTNVYLDDVLVK